MRGIGRHPPARSAFGSVMYDIAPNPGVHYRYHRIACGDWWVEDPRSSYYNRFRHERCNAPPPFRVTSQDLSRSPTAYRHLALIGYNSDPIVPGHLPPREQGQADTGCISLEIDNLITVLRWLRPAPPLIVIGTAATIRRY